MAKSAEKSLPFYQEFKKQTGKGNIIWTVEAEEALFNIKKHVHSLPSLASPKQGESLVMYLSTNQEVISTVLLAEREGKQIPVYFVSRVLRDAELNYTLMEKLTLSLVHSVRRLRRYFQAHQVTVLTINQSDKSCHNPKDPGD